MEHAGGEESRAEVGGHGADEDAMEQGVTDVEVLGDPVVGHRVGHQQAWGHNNDNINNNNKILCPNVININTCPQSIL